MSLTTIITIVSLSVSSSSILGLDSDFSGKISGTCRNVETIYNCSGIVLVDMPDASVIHYKTEMLDISNNLISNLNFSSFAFLGSSLTTLNASGNKITVLHNNVFQPLSNLVSLTLSNNLISGNILNELNFSFLRKLLYLCMKYNPLKIIKKDTFNFLELPTLMNLDISHCEIQELETFSFDLRALEYLDLSWNKIQKFKHDTFRMLSNLKVLDMSHNWIRTLNEVPYMPELINWNLDRNAIETIEIRANIEDFADNLHRLSLRNNLLLRFNSNSLPLMLDELQVIDMSNNGLHCDCRMKWINTMNLNLQNKNYTFECSYPANLNGRDLLKLEPDELICAKPLAKILFVVMVSTVLLLTVSVVTFFIIRRRRLKRRQQDDSGDYTAVFTRGGDDL